MPPVYEPALRELTREWTSEGQRYSGWGWALSVGLVEVSSGGGALGQAATSYNAEAHALLYAVQGAISQARTTQAYILHIVSDNAGLLQALTARKPNGAPSAIDAASRGLWDFLQSNPDCQLRLSWCPAHARVPGNERADRIAKDSTLLPAQAPFAGSTDLIRLRAKTHLLADWEAHWKKFGATNPNVFGFEALPTLTLRA